MASKAKPRGTRHSSTKAKKPATIDLAAKEVKAAAPASAKTATDTKAQSFGRPNASEKASETKPAAKLEPKADAKTEMKSEAKPEAKKPAPQKPAEKPTATNAKAANKGSFMSNLTSALMGGVAALVGFGAIGIWDGARELPIIGNFYGGSSSGNSSTLDSLKAQIAELKQGSQIDLSPIDDKLTALETSVTEISEGATANITEAATEKLIQLEQDFAGLNTTLNKFTTAAAAGQDTSSIALSTAVASITKRLDLMETDLGTMATSVKQNPALMEVTKAVDSMKTQVQEITGTLSGLQQTTQANKSGLTNLTEQSADLESTVASVKASEKIARSVAVNALATALENDDALSLPISSVKALIGETVETKRLEALNSSGIASRKQLVGGLDAVINSVQNPNAPSKDASISDRFWANAQSLVSFRTSGPQEGDTALAILSRVKAKVEADDLSAAKAEWEKLPADVRENGASWLAQLNTRMEAFALHNALNQKLTAEAG